VVHGVSANNGAAHAGLRRCARADLGLTLIDTRRNVRRNRFELIADVISKAGATTYSS
jgi:hypothetical protein